MTAGRPNLPLPTGGGRQLWLDVAVLGSWRIQRHVVTGHHRLLDPDDVRRAWGSEAECRRTLDAERAAGRAAVSSRTCCLLLHGYVRTKASFGRMRRALASAGRQVHDPNLPTMVLDVPALAGAVGDLLRDAEAGFDRVDLVTHSLGGILALHALAGRAPKGGGRLVMMAPPSRGSIMAQRILATRATWPGRVAGALLDRLVGRTLSQLGTGGSSLALRAPPPACPVLVIAGTRCPWWLPLRAADGESDGIVTVAEAARPDWGPLVTVPECHTLIMNHPETIDATLRFLDGEDVASSARVPEPPR